MMGETPREPRRKVRINARMRIDSMCVPVMICDVSTRGLMLRSPQPPPRGTYIEVLQPGVATVARVIWSSGTSFGVQTRDKLHIAAITGSPGSALEKPVRSLPANNRKAYVHGSHRHEASGWLAGKMQFIAVAAGGGLLGTSGSLLIYELLAEVSVAVAAGLL